MMSLRSIATLGAGAFTVAALLATSALADGMVTGNLKLQYDNLDFDHFNSNVWSGGGSVDFSLGSGFNLQGDGSYASADKDLSASAWNFGGEGFWRGGWGDVGGSLQYTSISPDHANDHTIMAYGAFGDWFAGDRVTVSLAGGWFSGNHSTDGNYFGGGVKFYAMPDLSIGGTVQHIEVNHHGGNATAWGLNAEWQVSDSVPLSIYGGYTNTSLSHTSSNLNTWEIGIKWHFGESGAPLVQEDRSEAVQTTNLGISTSLLSF